MKKQYFFIAFQLTIISLTSFADTWTVKQDGSGNFSSIQPAIDAAQEGDTVLIYPGTYYENLHFNGRNIKLGSLYLTTGDDAYRYNTIIDGNHAGSVIKIDQEEDNNTLICGLTIQNGFGGDYGGGGIKIWWGCGPVIKKCIIQHNVSWTGGGGIWSADDLMILSGNTIRYNNATRGGGVAYLIHNLFCVFDTVELNNCYLNNAGGGQDIVSSLFWEPYKIKLDTASVAYNDIYFIQARDEYGYTYPMITEVNHGIIQTSPHSLYVSPSGNNSNDGLSPQTPLKNISYAFKKIIPDSNEQRSIYLAPGTYSPSATGENFPVGLRSYISLYGSHQDSTIIDAESTSFFASGPNLTRNFSINDFTLLNGGMPSWYGFSSLLDLNLGNSNYSINNVAARNGNSNSGVASVMHAYSSGEFHLNNLSAINNKGGAAISINIGSEPSYCTINNLTLEGNGYGNTYEEGEGGIIFLTSENYNSRFSITNSLFVTNKAKQDPLWGPIGVLMGTGLDINNPENYMSVDIINSTFADNQMINQNLPFYHRLGPGGKANIYNSVYINSYMPEIDVIKEDPDYPAILNMDYNNIQDGLAGLSLSNTTILNWGAHNINADPLWDTTNAIPYAIPPESPCRNTGTPMYSPGMQPPYIIQQDTLYSLVTPDYDTIPLPSTDLRGKPRIMEGRIDMGAYEYDPFTGTDEQKLPAEVEVISVYPNPFYSNVFVSLEIKKAGYIKAEIYDMQGHLLKSLMDTDMPIGRCTITWDGKDELGWDVKIGEYLLKISIDGRQLPGAKVVRGKWR